jgi:hypothetical protein
MSRCARFDVIQSDDERSAPSLRADLRPHIHRLSPLPFPPPAPSLRQPMLLAGGSVCHRTLPLGGRRRHQPRHPIVITCSCSVLTAGPRGCGLWGWGHPFQQVVDQPGVGLDHVSARPGRGRRVAQQQPLGHQVVHTTPAGTSTGSSRAPVTRKSARASRTSRPTRVRSRPAAPRRPAPPGRRRPRQRGPGASGSGVPGRRSPRPGGGGRRGPPRRHTGRWWCRNSPGDTCALQVGLANGNGVADDTRTVLLKTTTSTSLLLVLAPGATSRRGRTTW